MGALRRRNGTESFRAFCIQPASSHRGLEPRQGKRIRNEGKGAALTLRRETSNGSRNGQEGSSFRGLARRWKAPRVRRSAVFFAEERAMRP